MNTSHSLLVSSTNLSFSYVALSSFFSPLAPLLPSPPLLFVQSTYSSLAKTDRGNGQSNTFIPSKRGNLQIPPILFQASLSIVLIFLSSFFFSFDRFSIFRPIRFFFFFFHEFLGARRSKSKRKTKKKKKKKKESNRSIDHSLQSFRSFHDHSVFVSKKKNLFLPSLRLNGAQTIRWKNDGCSNDLSILFANARYISRMPDSHRRRMNETTREKTWSMPCAPFLFFFLENLDNFPLFSLSLDR